VLLVPAEMTVADAHLICDFLEAKIAETYLETDISIHVEPLI